MGYKPTHGLSHSSLFVLNVITPKMVSSGVSKAGLSMKPSVVTLLSMIYSIPCPPVP